MKDISHLKPVNSMNECRKNLEKAGVLIPKKNKPKDDKTAILYNKGYYYYIDLKNRNAKNRNDLI